VLHDVQCHRPTVVTRGLVIIETTIEELVKHAEQIAHRFQVVGLAIRYEFQCLTSFGKGDSTILLRRKSKKPLTR